ncbi:MAG TPA: hypothetical protein PK668_09070 [Myxococcota bacterium]|nr:hypothetical protein [Myxococcota bacterium]HRY92869.1 hypothetical protein [Myxococcota bacterium]HSA20763.1 hypothetical protein [Myxococcota bacterium]
MRAERGWSIGLLLVLLLGGCAKAKIYSLRPGDARSAEQALECGGPTEVDAVDPKGKPVRIRLEPGDVLVPRGEMVEFAYTNARPARYGVGLGLLLPGIAASLALAGVMKDGLGVIPLVGPILVPFGLTRERQSSDDSGEGGDYGDIGDALAPLYWMGILTIVGTQATGLGIILDTAINKRGDIEVLAETDGPGVSLQVEPLAGPGVAGGMLTLRF